MSYQNELSVLAVKTANSSFSAIAELSKIIACYGDKKEVKNHWLECCEFNGLVRATSSDYWTLAMFFKGVFSSYQDAKNAGIKAIAARFELLGITSVKTAKSYKIAFSKVIAFSDSLKGYRTLNDNDVLESLIESCSISFKTTLENLLAIISSIESFMDKAAADKAAADKAAADKAAADKAAADKAAADKAAADKAAADKAAADKDAPIEDAPIEDAPIEDAPIEDAPIEDAPIEDTNNAAAAMRLHVLASLTTTEILAVCYAQDNDGLQAILKGVQAMIKARNKKTA